MLPDYDKETWLALQEDEHGPTDSALMATTVLDELRRENASLVESLEEVRMMFALEDRGWQSIFKAFSDSDIPGLDLEQLKEVSENIQTYIVGNPLIKRGTELRASYVWSKGVNIPGAEEVPGKRGRKSAVHRFVNKPQTQRFLSSAAAHSEMERAAVASGLYILAGRDSTREILYPIPLAEIDGLYCNPDYVGEVWAYRRKWNYLTLDGTREVRTRWYFTDRYPGVRPATLGEQGARVEVDRDVTVFDQRFNSQVGWPLGVPDGLAAIVWARIYTELMNHGKVMTESLAKFAFKVASQSAKGASDVGVKLVGSSAMGATAALGSGNDLVPMSSAGRAYDFDGIRPVAAMVATALEVSIVHLLSDPGAAGSSYGSASNLDLPTKRAMVARQNLWADFIERIVEWGTGVDVNVTFPSLDDPDPYREQQIVALAWNSGTVHEDEVRPRFLEIAGLEALHDTAPDGVLLPNNRHSWERADIDPKDGPALTAASPDQGVSNGTGGSDSALKNDQREDFGAMVQQLQSQAFLDELRSLVERMENVKN